MKVRILSSAVEDLKEGFQFYESQNVGLGNYFLDTLYSDIDSLRVTAGVHELHFGYFRSLSVRFPFAIYYKIENNEIRIRAVLDCRRKPAWVREQLEN